MSLTVLVVVVFAGISLVVLAVHLSGGSKLARIESKRAAVQRLATDFEEETAKDVYITRDARTAFMLLESGMVGIVHGVGDMFLTRCLSPFEITRLERRSEMELVVELSDLAWPGGVFEFDDGSTCDALIDRLRIPANSEKEIA